MIHTHCDVCASGYMKKERQTRTPTKHSKRNDKITKSSSAKTPTTATTNKKKYSSAAQCTTKCAGLPGCCVLFQHLFLLSPSLHIARVRIAKSVCGPSWSLSERQRRLLFSIIQNENYFNITFEIFTFYFFPLIIFSLLLLLFF